MQRNITTPPFYQFSKSDIEPQNGGSRYTECISDEQIISHALQGDDYAYTELFNRYKRKILYVCFQYSDGDWAKAHDLCQETFISAFDRLAKLRDKSRFSSWLHEIAKNKCISYARKQQTFNKVLKEYEVFKQTMINDKPDWKTEAGLKVIEDLINNLDRPDVKKTIQMFYMEGKETTEIAKLQGISQTAVTSRLNRFRVKLRKRIALEVLIKHEPEE